MLPRFALLVTVSAALALTSGCVVAHHGTVTPAQPNGYRQVANARGCTFFLFGAIPIAKRDLKSPRGGAHSTGAVIEAAGEGMPLEGVSADHLTRLYPFGTQTCTRVHGYFMRGG